ncbi:dihydrofolate reductase family protein [Parabacteroides provencensis]|uniref:dihydrofolate reductase family protein n=1 Tax=Parabacteroides provencensis TaxID=1944636 RepID=UPI000C1541B9|nr:dihydrofolate reductase family protein [Parabacteroides provencensis]
MRRIILYIATSIDGYIATPDGGVEWLDEIPNPNKTDLGYNALMDSIDTVLMGGRTYHEIIGFGVEWPYKSKVTYVVSRRNSNVTPNEDVHFITEDIVSKTSELKNEAGKDIWLIGGGELTTILLNANLIDEMRLCIAPIILGQGIPLFPNKPKESSWTLTDSKAYDTGIVLSTYRRK